MSYEPVLEDIKDLMPPGEYDRIVKERESNEGVFGGIKRSLKKRLKETELKSLPRDVVEGLGAGVANIPIQAANLVGAAIGKQPTIPFSGGKPLEPFETKGLGGLVGELSPIGGALGYAGKIMGLSKSPKFVSKLAESMFKNSPELLRKYGTKAVEGAGTLGKNAAFGGATTLATVNPLESEDYLSDILGGMVLGAGFSVAPGAAMAAKRGIKKAAGMGKNTVLGTFPDVYAQQHILEGINPEAIAPRIKAAERLGFVMQPHEANKNFITSQKIGNVGKSMEGSKIIQEFGEERQKKIETGLNDFLDKIYNKKEMDPIKNQHYKSSQDVKIPEDLTQELTKKPVFKQAIDEIQRSPAFQQEIEDRGLKENTIGYFDLIKQSLGELAEGHKGIGKGKQRNIYKNTEKNLKNILDDVSPEYKKGVELAERSIARKKIEKAMNIDEYTPNAIYRKVLKNKEKFNDLHHSLRNVEGGQKTLTDMKEIYGDLQSPVGHKEAASTERMHLSKPREISQQLFNFLMKTIGKKHDVAMAELITNPTWHQKVSSIKNVKSPERKASELSKLLSQALAAASAKQSRTKPNGNGNGNGEQK